MLCERVTRKVAKKPQRICCETEAEPCMVKPMTTATMKQMMERREAVNKPKTITFDSTKFRNRKWIVSPEQIAGWRHPDASPPEDVSGLISELVLEPPLVNAWGDDRGRDQIR